MAVIIKGKLLSSDRPIVCVPIVETTREEILSRTRELAEAGVEMLEWRADYFEELEDAEAVREVLEAMRPLTQQAILLVTIRSKAQGGWCELSPQEVKSLYVGMAAVHSADMFDVEFFSHEKPEHLIKKLQERGAMVVSSHHDFEETPSEEVMETLLSQMLLGDADVLKLAVMPKNVVDVLSLLKVTSQFHEAHPGMPLITMSMGSLGMISRISGEVFGSCVTFGSVGKTSAPGQMPREELERMLAVLHRYK